MNILHSILGIFILLGICYCLSNNKTQINWRLIIGGIGLQFLIAILAFKVPLFIGLLESISVFFAYLINFSNQGAEFVFGTTLVSDLSFGSTFAFKVLPAIIFFSALTSVLYYFNILQFLIKTFAFLLQSSMKLSATESLSAAANIFIGCTEAPLVIKPYLKSMSHSEILCLMTGGMATIAGSMFAAYVFLLGGDSIEAQKSFAQHLLIASILSAPIAIVCSKLIYPETSKIETKATIEKEEFGSNLFEAIMHGTTQGVQLALNVGACLIVFISIISLCNYICIEWIGEFFNLNNWTSELTNGLFDNFSIEFIFGILFYPIAWLIGIPLSDCLLAGQLLGEKLVFNEFISYTHLGEIIQSESLEKRSVILLSYALCGFSNFATIGIIIGGLGTLAPEKKKVFSQLALRSLTGGFIACLITACIAGIFI